MEDLKTGTEFGGYKLKGKLGKGGMGNVYKALDVGFDRIIAIKITEALEKVSEDDIRRFEAEAHAMKNLEHQNITPVYNYGIVQDRQYIAMKFVQGKTLAELLNQKSLKEHQIVDFSKQIARALLYAHSNNIVHRDVKPSNIMVQPDGHLYLGDFGISYALNQDRLTKVGMAMGTPEYMSPEQCQGLKLDTRTDIYAFGIILYELCTGMPPFTGDKPLAIAYKHVHEEIEFPANLSEKIPEKILEVIEACLQKDPKNRPQKMSQVLDALDQVNTKELKPRAKTLRPQTIARPKHPKPATGSSSIHIVILYVLLSAALLWNLYLTQTKGSFESSPFVEDIHFETPNSEQPISIDSIQQFDWKQRATQGYLRLKVHLPQPMLVSGVGMQWERAKQDAPPPARVYIEAQEGDKRVLKTKKLKSTQFFKFNPFVSDHFEIQIPSSERFVSNSHILSQLKVIAQPVDK